MDCPVCKVKLEFPITELEEAYYDCPHCHSSLLFNKGQCEVLNEGKPGDLEPQNPPAEVGFPGETDPVSKGNSRGESESGSSTSEAVGAFQEPADQAESNQAESNQAESNQAESNQAESNQAESNQAESNQAESNQAESNQAESNQAESNQAESNQAESNQAESNQAESNQAEFNPAESNQAESNQAESNQAESNQAESNQAESNQAESNQAESNPAESNLAESSNEEEEEFFPNETTQVPELGAPEQELAATPSGPEELDKEAQPPSPAEGQKASPSDDSSQEDFPFQENPAEEPPPPSQKEDFVEVAEFGNTADQDKQGPFLYDLILSEINSQDTKEKVLAVLEDESLSLLSEEGGPSIKNGKIALEKISPVQAYVIVTALMGLPLRVFWTQRHIADSP